VGHDHPATGQVAVFRSDSKVASAFSGNRYSELARQAVFNLYDIHPKDQVRRLPPAKGCNPVSGFEIEAWLVDYAMQPAPVNDQFLSSFNNPLACEELAKFNIELNSTPLPLQADVLRQIHKQFQATWDKAVTHAQSLNKELLMIGTLPTLQPSDLTLANMSDRNRYRALNEQILKSRGKPVHLDIIGEEH